ncbi:cation diffusion facilitator family transporter [Candidatus Bipolaricaulota bacterium]|nr:cation diffusion facilitator family transporter [Candidatus Bipolaricaulota bacterium]
MNRTHSIRSPRDPGDRVTFVGIIWNILLLGVKLIVGFLTGSVGLIADGIHSGSDMATDLAVLGGMHLARRKADADHPYGHGRFETLAGGIVAGALILVGAFIAWEGIIALYRAIHSFPGPAVICVAAVSIGIKEWMYRRTVMVARSVGSAALHANAWHHRSDALSSIAVLAGGVGSLVGWGHADQLASIIVGLMVVAAGGRTLFVVLHELTEGGVSRDEIEKIEQALEAVEGTREWHDLRTRRVGRETFIDLHVLVAPELSIVEAHKIASDVEVSLHRACSHPANVVVHIEPDVEEQRRR